MLVPTTISQKCINYDMSIVNIPFRCIIFSLVGELGEDESKLILPFLFQATWRITLFTKKNFDVRHRNSNKTSTIKLCS